MKRILRSIVAVLGACGLVISMPSLASADRDNNNWMFEAEPVPASVASVEGVADGNDVDWYTFAVSGIQQMQVTFTSDDTCYDRNFAVMDSSGEDISLPFTTPPGTNRFYISVGDNCSNEGKSNKYKVTIETAGRVDPDPLPVAQPTGEPNETKDGAIGPLGDGQWYHGSIDTTNDEDWFFFYVAPGTHQITIQTNRPPFAGRYSYYGADIELVGLDYSNSPGRMSATANSHRSQAVTVTGPQMLWVSVSDDAIGMPWWFSVSGGLTSTLLTPPPPPPPPPAAPTPPPPASCRITSTRVKKRSKIRGTCKRLSSGTRVEARWYRYTSKRKTAKRIKSVFVTVNKSRVLIPTKGRVRGFYRVTLIRNGQRLGTRQVRIR